MRFSTGSNVISALVLLAAAGCGETDGTGGSGAAAGAGGGAGSAGSGGGDMAALQIFTGEWDPELPGIGLAGPLEGVEVCQADTANCVVSDANGSALLPLPIEQEVALTVEKEGHVSLLGSEIVPPNGSYTSFAPAREALYEERFQSVMSPYPMQGTGAIVMNLLGSVERATFELLGTTAKGFYYADPGWDAELPHTQAGAGGGFVEVVPGQYQIEVHGAESCVVVRGWPGDSDTRIKLPVRAGYASTARINCD